MHVRLTSPANAELAAALEWYANIESSLSVRFLDEYEAVIEKLRDNPWQFPVVHNGVRRAGLWRFPYALLYRVHPAEVEIIACFHARRDPRRWQDRN
jgi:plasmid stabilization system protein ParE